MNIETVIDRPKFPPRRSSLALTILTWKREGHSLRTIHEYLPGASWAVICDSIYDAYWRKLMVGAIQL